MAEGFDTPAYKLLINDLKSAKYNHLENTWSYELTSDSIGVHRATKKVSLELTMFWIQGTVISKSNGNILIKDSSGRAIIEDYKDVPGGEENNVIVGKIFRTG